MVTCNHKDQRWLTDTPQQKILAMIIFLKVYKLNPLCKSQHSSESNDVLSQRLVQFRESKPEIGLPPRKDSSICMHSCLGNKGQIFGWKPVIPFPNIVSFITFCWWYSFREPWTCLEPKRIHCPSEKGCTCKSLCIWGSALLVLSHRKAFVKKKKLHGRYPVETSPPLTAHASWWHL